MIKSCKHTTVLLNEAVDSLDIRPDGIYIDGTFGCGGHSHLILSKLGKNGCLLAIDRDPKSIAIAKTINDPRFSIIYGSFSRLASYISKLRLMGKIDGVLFDLGISSLQLDDTERGFSFMHNGFLDMRMDPTQGLSAADWLKTAKEDNIAWILKTFGEERFAKRIAKAIVNYKCIKPITCTKELVEIIINATPVKDKFKHPATRTFQAIRIWINNELKEIELALRSSLSILTVGGRLSVISFHSLEDRIVKHFMRDQSKNLQVPSGLILNKEQFRKTSSYQLLALGKLMPKKEEIKRNPRARSSILRFAKKIKIDNY